MRTPPTPTGTGSRPSTVVPPPGTDVTVTSPSSAPSRSAIPCRPVPCGGRNRIEAPAVVGHGERRCVDRRSESVIRRRRRLGVLRDVLHRLETREVDGGLDRPAGSGRRRRRGARSAARTSGPGPRARRAAPCRPAAGGRCPGPGRAGPRVPCASHSGLAEQLARLLRVPLDQVVGELELDRQRHELLLRAVMDVALEPAAALVLRGDQPLLRGLQLVEPQPSAPRQANVAQHQPRLAGEVRDQLLVRGRHGVARRLADRERAEQLARLTRPGTRGRARGSAGRTRSAAVIGGPADRRRRARPRRRAAPGRRRATRPPARLRCPRRGSAPSAAARPRRRRRRRRVRRTPTAPRTAWRACRRRPGWRTA